MKADQKIIFFLTVLSFSAVNFLVVSFSFVKRYLQVEFQMTSTELGMMDGLRFLGNAVGLVVFICSKPVPDSQLPFRYSISISLNCIFLGLVPLSALLEWHSKYLVFVANFLGGFFKAPSWTLLIQLVKQELFETKQDSPDVKNQHILEEIKSADEIMVNPQIEGISQAKFEGERYLEESRRRMIQRARRSGESYSQESVLSQEENKHEVKNRFIIWTSLTLSGNIVGLLLCQILVYNLDFNWEVCILIPICIILLSAALVVTFFSLRKTPNQQEDGPYIAISEAEARNQNNAEIPSSNPNIGFKDVITGSFKLLCMTPKVTLIISLVFLLGIHSLIMSFLPLFMFKIGYHHFEGYLLAWYNTWVIAGAFFFTNFHRIARSFRKFLNSISLGLLLITLFILSQLSCPYQCACNQGKPDMDPMLMDNSYNFVAYFCLLGLFGLSLGGPLNRFESSQLTSTLEEFEEKLLQKQTDSENRENLETRNHRQVENIQQSSEGESYKIGGIFIGMTQLLSYGAVMMLLVLAGAIIQNWRMSFFTIMILLTASVVFLDIVLLCESKCSENQKQEREN